MSFRILTKLTIALFAAGSASATIGVSAPGQVDPKDATHIGRNSPYIDKQQTAFPRDPSPIGVMAPGQVDPSAPTNIGQNAPEVQNQNEEESRRE